MTSLAAPRSGSLTSTLVSSQSGQESSDESASSTSASESDSNSAEESSDEEDDDDEETMQKMKDLLLKAKLSARAKEQQKKQAAAGKGKAVEVEGGDELAGNEGMVLFGDDDDDDDEQSASGSEDESASTPRASSSSSKPKINLPPSLVRPLHLRAPTAAALALDPKGKGKLTLAQDLGGAVESESSGTGRRGDKWGKAPVKQLSKNERKALKAPTAGPKWFNMPATPVTPELKREIQALRLRNALDPKRFYKGGAKDSKTLPEFFQLGHVIDDATQGGRSVSTAKMAVQRKRTFVEELVEDEQARAYTKRKTKEVMERGMSGRRGGNRKGASKRRKQ